MSSFMFLLFWSYLCFFVFHWLIIAEKSRGPRCISRYGCGQVAGWPLVTDGNMKRCMSKLGTCKICWVLLEMTDLGRQPLNFRMASYFFEIYKRAKSRNDMQMSVSLDLYLYTMYSVHIRLNALVFIALLEFKTSDLGNTIIDHVKETWFIATNYIRSIKYYYKVLSSILEQCYKEKWPAFKKNPVSILKYIHTCPPPGTITYPLPTRHFWEDDVPNFRLGGINWSFPGKRNGGNVFRRFSFRSLQILKRWI